MQFLAWQPRSQGKTSAQQAWNPRRTRSKVVVLVSKSVDATKGQMLIFFLLAN